MSGAAQITAATEQARKKTTEKGRHPDHHIIVTLPTGCGGEAGSVLNIIEMSASDVSVEFDVRVYSCTRRWDWSVSGKSLPMVSFVSRILGCRDSLFFSGIERSASARRPMLPGSGFNFKLSVTDVLKHDVIFPAVQPCSTEADCPTLDRTDLFEMPPSRETMRVRKRCWVRFATRFLIIVSA